MSISSGLTAKADGGRHHEQPDAGERKKPPRLIHSAGSMAGAAGFVLAFACLVHRHAGAGR